MQNSSFRQQFRRFKKAKNSIMKKYILFYSVLILTFFVSGGHAIAQFSFEIPNRMNANLRTFALEPISVNVSGKLALRTESEKGSILLNVTGGKSPYTYQWNTLETSKDIFNLNPGVYTVDIKDSEGKSHSERIVVQPPYPLIINRQNIVNGISR
jgi:hypothetical protein